jgi:hypothetical protein
VKRLVRERAEYRCEYCHIHQDDEVFQHHLEHIIPKQHLGTEELDNLALSCHYCNRHKGTNLTAFDPLDGSLQVLFHPRHHDWHAHFALEQGVVKGCSPIGRATVRLFRMNDTDRVIARLNVR